MGASSASHKEKEEGSSPCAQTFSACGGAAIAAYKVYMEYEILRSSPFDYLTAAATPLRAIVKDCSRKKEKKSTPAPSTTPSSFRRPCVRMRQTAKARAHANFPVSLFDPWGSAFSATAWVHRALCHSCDFASLPFAIWLCFPASRSLSSSSFLCIS